MKLKLFTRPLAPVRRLKIEETGDFWKGPVKPKIRLMGLWLEQAGFRPGEPVQVTCRAPGVIELRSPLPLQPLNQNANEQTNRAGTTAFRDGADAPAADPGVQAL